MRNLTQQELKELIEEEITLQIKSDITLYCKSSLFQISLVDKGFSKDQVNEILLSLHESGQRAKTSMTGTEAALARKIFLLYTDEFANGEVKQIGVYGGLWDKKQRNLKGTLYRVLLTALESNIIN